LVNVHLIVLSQKNIFECFAKICKTNFCSWIRTKEIGANGEPLYLDVRDMYTMVRKMQPVIVGGRYGLSSKTPLHQ
jgi:pyruvate-ferredoxin/flavodoxin oxidoreductase